MKLRIKQTLAKLLTGTVKGYTSIVIRDSSHQQSIPAYSHKDVIYDLRTLGAAEGNAFMGYSVLCDSNTNLVVTMVSADGYNLTIRFTNPTNTAQTMHGVIGILKYLRY